MKNIFLPAFCCIFLLACGDDSSSTNNEFFSLAEETTLVDNRDGNAYKTVKIGSQIWMSENLRYADTNYVVLCFEDKGCFYSWDAARSENLCPKGWKLPDTTDWKLLMESVGGAAVAGKRLKSANGWKQNQRDLTTFVSGGGTDEYGFSAFPVGVVSDTLGLFYGISEVASFWSVSEKDESDAFSTCFYYTLEMGNYVCLNPKDNMLAVRCVKNQ